MNQADFENFMEAHRGLSARAMTEDPAWSLIQDYLGESPNKMIKKTRKPCKKAVKVVPMRKTRYDILRESMESPQ